MPSARAPSLRYPGGGKSVGKPRFGSRHARWVLSIWLVGLTGSLGLQLRLSHPSKQGRGRKAGLETTAPGSDGRGGGGVGESELLFGR